MAEPATCDGRVALVTGASRGIGAAIAARLAAAGARVATSARTLEPGGSHAGSLTETVDAIRSAGGDAVAVRCDLSNGDERAAMVAEVTERLGPIDILVNNAAVTFLRPIDEFPEKRFKLMVEVQVWAAYDLVQRVLPSMRAAGAGWILNVSSRAGLHPVGPPFEAVHLRGGWTAYGMVKAALDRFSTAAAAELYDANIAVSSLAPWDNVATAGAAHHDLVADIPLEGPEWMAEAALALCSHPPQQLTGRVAYSQPLLAELGIRPRRG